MLIVLRKRMRTSAMEDNKLDVVSIRLKKEHSLLSDEPMNQPIVAVNAIGKYLSDMDREVICVINLQSDLKPINCSFVSTGVLDGAMTTPREVLKSSILSNAKSIILLHNHPSNNLSPSRADIETTDRMIKSCEIMGISFLDHIIVGSTAGEFFSLRENSLMTDKNITCVSSMDRLRFSVDEAAMAYMVETGTRLKRKSR